MPSARGSHDPSSPASSSHAAFAGSPGVPRQHYPGMRQALLPDFGRDATAADVHARELTHAARMYAAAEAAAAMEGFCAGGGGQQQQQQPSLHQDYDTLYSYALVLQELGGKVAAASAERAQHLQEVCRSLLLCET